ncbi:unnamed protein product [Vicia faba]|uniref:Uncharacterized protein n=1 Tax=Vicia faba TaxID=3906 RepID=A0AAV1A2R9_VICFA|nr:unnamed protein product [Vicia faba]
MAIELQKELISFFPKCASRTMLLPPSSPIRQTAATCSLPAAISFHSAFQSSSQQNIHRPPSVFRLNSLIFFDFVLDSVSLFHQLLYLIHASSFESTCSHSLLAFGSVHHLLNASVTDLSSSSALSLPLRRVSVNRRFNLIAHSRLRFASVSTYTIQFSIALTSDFDVWITGFTSTNVRRK